MYPSAFPDTAHSYVSAKPVGVNVYEGYLALASSAYAGSDPKYKGGETSVEGANSIVAGSVG